MPAADTTSSFVQQIVALFNGILKSIGYENTDSAPVLGTAASSAISPGLGGQGTYTTAYAGKTNNDPSAKLVNEDTLFNIGSITKGLVAWLLMDAIANSQGKSTLNDPLSKYFPKFTAKFPKWANITLTQLLNMTSGIPDYLTEDFSQYTQDPNKNWTLAEIILSMPEGQLGELNSTPGSEWDYSNTNYILLGIVLEQITGKTAEELIANFAQQKLGLKPSQLFYATGLVTDPNFADPYDVNGVNVSKTINPTVLGTAGGIIATATAILKLMEWMYDPTKNPHLQTMLSIMVSTTTAQPMPNGPTTQNPWGYAAGLIQGLLPALGLISLYAGEVDGATAEYQRIMTNLGPFIAAYAINTEYTNLPSFVDILNPILTARGADPISEKDKAEIDNLVAQMRAKIKPLKVLSKPASAPVPQPTAPAAAKTSDAKGSDAEEKNASCVNSYLNYGFDFASELATSLTNLLCCASARKNIQEKIDDVKSQLVLSPKP